MSSEYGAKAALAALAAVIVPADDGIATAVRASLQGSDEIVSAGVAARLAAAQHTIRPRMNQRHIVVCAGDHGLARRRSVHVDGSLGLVASGHAPARTALAHLAAGNAAVNAAAHAADAGLMLVDCGVGVGVDDKPLPGVLDVRIGSGTGDIRHEPAMTLVQAGTSMHTGAALLLSLAETGLDVVGVGQLAIGARAVSGAVIAALIGVAESASISASNDPDRADIAAALARHRALDERAMREQPLQVLANLGGFELGVMAGIVLAAASIQVPVVLDGHGAIAAALLATSWQPAVQGYLFAAHAGASWAHRTALTALGLAPLYGQAIAHGEGTGAALAMPVLEQAAARCAALSEPV